jgi:hypothetical protein
MTGLAAAALQADRPEQAAQYIQAVQVLQAHYLPSGSGRCKVELGTEVRAISSVTAPVMTRVLLPPQVCPAVKVRTVNAVVGPLPSRPKSSGTLNESDPALDGRRALKARMKCEAAVKGRVWTDPETQALVEQCYKDEMQR